MVVLLVLRCICSNKDKNFKANHNFLRCSALGAGVVSVVTKIRILKQITTIRPNPLAVTLLYL